MCWLLVAVGQLGDIVTTGVDMRLVGTQEANSYVIAMIEHFGLTGYFLIKFIVVVGASLFLLRLVNRFLTRYPKKIGHQTLADLTVFVTAGGGVFLIGASLLNVWVGAAMWDRIH